MASANVHDPSGVALLCPPVHFSYHLKLDKHPGTGPCPPALPFFCPSCKASSSVQAPTCQGCNFKLEIRSKKSSYFRHTLPLRLVQSSIIYLSVIHVSDLTVYEGDRSDPPNPSFVETPKRLQSLRTSMRSFVSSVARSL